MPYGFIVPVSCYNPIFQIVFQKGTAGEGRIKKEDENKGAFVSQSNTYK